MRCFFRSLAVTCAAVLLAGAFAPAAISQALPSDVAIYYNGTFKGNGVLLSSNEVLTTAAVVDGTQLSGLLVEAGSATLGGGTSVPVVTYTMHQGYGVGPWTMPNDIALVLLATPLTYSASISPAMLPASNVDQFTNKPAYVTGWWSQGCPGVLSNSASWLDMTVISTDAANLLMSDVIGADVHDSQLPLLNSDLVTTPGAMATGSGIYAQDASGQTVLVGLYSWGISSPVGTITPSSCVDATHPAVGTRTAFYLGWIAANSAGGGGSGPIVNLGNWKPGTDGKAPMLLASGPLTAGSVNTLTLTNAKSNSYYYFCYGMSLGNLSFMGGVMVPGGTYIYPAKLPIDSAGTASLLMQWPSGISGVPVYLQYWVKDVGAIAGFSASNGLQLTGQS